MSEIIKKKISLAKQVLQLKQFSIVSFKMISSKTLTNNTSKNNISYSASNSE